MKLFKMKKTTVLFVSFLFLFSCKQPNTDWFQFRGTNALGIASKSATPPTDFGPDKNLIWKTEIPRGLSTPILVDENLIATGADTENKKYIVWCVNSKNGEISWQTGIEVNQFEKVHTASSPAAATPVSDGEYIYCYFSTFGLVCLNLEGNKIWEKTIEFKPVLQGSGTSPVIHENKLILNHDNLVQPKLMVFDKANGELIWDYAFKIRPMVSSTSWSTPVIWKNQVIIHRLNEIIGIDLETGKQIWNFDIGTTGCGTPVIIEDILYVNAWMIRGEKSFLGDVIDFQQLFSKYDKNLDNSLSAEEFPNGIVVSERPEGKDLGDGSNRLYWGMIKAFDYDKNNLISIGEWKDLMGLMADYGDHGLVAIQLGDTGNITLSAQKWRIKENIPETPSVVVDNKLVFMAKNGGTVTCVDASSGKVLFVEKLGVAGTYFASPLAANQNIYFTSFNGKITIIKNTPQFEIVNQIDLKERIGASPIAFDKKLIIRTENNLYAFGE
jgi:outer membrane protein assembly factor BamB